MKFHQSKSARIVEFLFMVAPVQMKLGTMTVTVILVEEVLPFSDALRVVWALMVDEVELQSLQ
jgi:hypothetical protein